MNIKKLISILIVGILFTSLNSILIVNAQQIQTSLTITVPSEPQWKELTIEATLKDENDNPLQNMDIGFYYAHMDGTWCVHLLGTTKTDSNGVASQTYIFPLVETLRFHAVFNGTTNYASSVSEYVTTIFVYVDNTPYMVGGIIAVAIICIAGYIIFRRRKKD